jgi:dihydroorotate dehydrogenase
MYKPFIRPLLFLLDPERVHHLVILVVKAAVWFPGARKFLKLMFGYESPGLRTKIAGMVFENKVGLAAGFDKNAEIYREFALFGFSFIEIGTVTPLPQPGNVRPRLFRLPSDRALINRMGFNNKGVEYAVNKLKGRDHTVIIGGNIGKNTQTSNAKAADDYAVCFNTLYEHVDYLAVNVSCPNIAGLEKLQDQDALREILDRIMDERGKKASRKPVFLKISPDLSPEHLDEIITLCQEVGIDGIIATNTTTRRENLSTPDFRVREMGQGGLSGQPLKHRVKKMISYICKQTGGTLPVIGVGGVQSPEDALEMIRAGASLVQVYTGFIYEGPFLVKRINKAIEKYIQQQ